MVTGKGGEVGGARKPQGPKGRGAEVLLRSRNAPLAPRSRTSFGKHSLDRWLRNAPSPRLVEHLLAQENDRRWRGVLRGLPFGSFHARLGDITLPDGRQTHVMLYPRVSATTDFDAVSSDAFMPPSSETEESSP